MMKIINLLIAGIFLISIVSAIGVTVPQPQNIELKPGQASFFTFQIQSDDFPLICIPILQEAGGLELAVNQQYEVEPNQRYVVKPQVIAPQQSGFGNYKATFCISCSPSEEVEGSKVVTEVCNLPVTVDVVSERTRENMFEEEIGPAMGLWITLLLVAIVFLAIVIFYLIRKRSSAAV